MSGTKSDSGGASGKVRDLGLHLLDRQVEGPDGAAVGNVDDLELTVPDDGSPPYVTAILTGPQGLASRLGGRLGGWLLWWCDLLGPPGSDQPGRIGIELVTDIGSSITVARTRRELGVHANEERADHYVIERIPGARHASK